MILARHLRFQLSAGLTTLQQLQCSRAVRQAHSKSGVNVVLEQAVDRLGEAGDQVSTTRGYARNFLIPGRLARQLPKARTRISAPGEAAEAKRRRGKGNVAASSQNLQHVLNLLYNNPVDIIRKLRKTPRKKATLRQPVTPACIARAVLDQHRVLLSPQLLAMDEVLKYPGSHEVPLRLVDAAGQRITMNVAINTMTAKPVIDPSQPVPAANPTISEQTLPTQQI